VPHSWLICTLKIYKIDPLIINSLQELMKKWPTTLQVKVKNHRIMSDPISIQGIYQGIVLAVMVLTCIKPPFLPAQQN
jgi:hypothetical protein